MADSEHVKVAIVAAASGLHRRDLRARANLAPVMFEGGGTARRTLHHTRWQLTITTDVENYPGFPRGIMGPKLMELLRAQAERFGTSIRTTDVTAVDLGARPFRIAAGEDNLLADTLIIATGPRPSGWAFRRKTSFATTAFPRVRPVTGPSFKGREVLVVGGGDTAMEEANYLTHHVSKVTIIHRRDEFRASRIMLDRARNNPKIPTHHQCGRRRDSRATAKPGVTGVRLRDTRTGSPRELACGGVFMAIGHQPQASYSGAGWTWTRSATSAPRRDRPPPACGRLCLRDVADHVYRQAITAAGTGCMAAIDVERFLAHG